MLDGDALLVDWNRAEINGCAVCADAILQFLDPGSQTEDLLNVLAVIETVGVHIHGALQVSSYA